MSFCTGGDMSLKSFRVLLGELAPPLSG